MTTKTYGSFSTRQTPQSQPIPGEDQIANHAGGFAYQLDKWAVLNRFLVLGTEGGTYYVQERQLTTENALNVIECLADDAKRTVDLIVGISDAGRAPKNDPAIFALALAASSRKHDKQGMSDADIRAYALAALPKVCRIPTHLFHFLTFALKQRRWSRMLRTAVAKWYGQFEAGKLAYELVKYQSRDGWSNRDVLRTAHIGGVNSPVLRWAIGAGTDVRDVKRPKESFKAPRRYQATADYPAIITAFEAAKTASTSELCDLITTHGLTREMIPTEALKKPEVWDALLQKMPLTALLRNLGNMSKVELLTPMSDASRMVVKRLQDADAYKKARVHPVAVLIALKIYGQGKGMKGSGEWTPVPAVVDALDAGFYLAFGAVEPTNKRLLYALDISYSMGSPITGLPLSCAEGTAAMSLVCARTEQDYHILGFAHELRSLGITPKMRLDDALKKTRDSIFGGTDCSLPMRWALEKKVPVDGFVVITDNETWAGGIHPSQALREYRQKMGIPAKQVVMGMTATEISIADPKDGGTLDVVGFDAATPQAVSEFLR